MVTGDDLAECGPIDYLEPMMTLDSLRRRGIRSLAKAGMYSLFFTLLAVAGPYAGAQRPAPPLDSLDRVLRATREPAARSALYARLVPLATPVDPVRAEAYARQWLRLAARMSGTADRAEGCWQLSRIFRQTSRPDSQRLALGDCLRLLEDCGSPRCATLRYRCADDLSVHYENQGMMRQAIATLASALEDPALPAPHHADALTLLGTYYYELGNYNEALEQYRRSIEIGTAANDPEYNYLSTLYNMANVYNSLGNTAKVTEIAGELMELGRRDRSLHYVYLAHWLQARIAERNGVDAARRDRYREMLRLAEELGNRNFIAEMTARLLYADTGTTGRRYALRAERMLRDSVPLRIYSQNDLYRSLAEYQRRQGNFDRARTYALQRLDYLANMTGDTSRLALEAREDLTHLLAEAGRFEAAWSVYDELYRMKLTQVERTHQEALARTAIDMDLAEHESARRAAEETVRLERARNRLYTVALLLAGLILVVVVLAYRRVRRDRRLITTQHEALAQSLGEKEVLLREIHHRVKNNLQIISGLLDKQLRKTSDARMRELVRQGQERIQSMALVHQNLYRSERLSALDLRAYLQELLANIQYGHAGSDPIDLRMNVADEKLDIDTAIPVGLILNELLTNAYKYAFDPGQTGTIAVDFYREADRYTLCVSDDGKGLPSSTLTDTAGPNGGTSLGLNLVRGLVRQLRGRIEWPPTAKGTTVLIQF